VTTPGEVARQIMQQVYTKATFHPRHYHSAPERPKILTVESTEPFPRRPDPLGLTWRQHPTECSPGLMTLVTVKVYPAGRKVWMSFLS